jgi:hypothetical protein
MFEKKYEILIDGTQIASNMQLHDATIFIKALFNEYYNDTDMNITIKQMESSYICHNCEVNKGE